MDRGAGAMDRPEMGRGRLPLSIDCPVMDASDSEVSASIAHVSADFRPTAAALGWIAVDLA